MANAILNFHFDYLNPSLIWIISWIIVDQFIQARICLALVYTCPSKNEHFSLKHDEKATYIILHQEVNVFMSCRFRCNFCFFAIVIDWSLLNRGERIIRYSNIIWIIFVYQNIRIRSIFSNRIIFVFVFRWFFQTD